MSLFGSTVRVFLSSSVSIIALSVGTQIALANPTGGIIESGQAEIGSPADGNLLITQTSNKAIINWDSFDIGIGETTTFALPSRDSVTLNRDFSGDPSAILGSLQSNGRLYLVNPSGILFGTGATVDVAGLVATTHDISSNDFLNDDLRFTIAGDDRASVINKGRVTVDDLGFAAFVAPHVRNDGAIIAHMGRVDLASANGFALDLYGDRLISFFVENPNGQQILDENGNPISALVENHGSITADGGQVFLTASAARGVVDSVINTDGIIQANTVEKRGGKIVLGGGGSGTVRVSGSVKARGNVQGDTGGTIIVTGDILTADQHAIMDVSGWYGGGKLLFGGDYLGGNATNEQVAKYRFTMEDEAVQTSTAVFLAEGAKLAADGLVDGDGGKLIVWSDEMTVTAADISARGGALSGNGGFIETSGGYLQVEKAADASATNGLEGTWLLDPTNITIDRSGTNSLWTFRASEFFNTLGGGGFVATSFRPTANTSVLSANLIESALNNGSNVVVSTFDTLGTASGDIRIRTDITKTSGGNARLSILAGDDITIDPGVDIISRSGTLLIELWAAFGSIVGTGAGRFDTNGGELMLTARDGISFSSTFNMPDNLSINLNNDGIGSGIKQVDVRFDGDRIRFGYSASNLELYAGAISLLDTNATGALYLRFLNAMNAHLSDRAIVGVGDRSWEVGPTVSASAVGSSALNGIPEIEGFPGVTWQFGAEPGAGYVPVLEVSALRDGTADVGRHIVTAPSGNAALSAYLTRPATVPPVQVVVNQALNPNINVQAALAGVQLLPGLSCQLGAVQCAGLPQTATELSIPSVRNVNTIVNGIKAGQNVLSLYGDIQTLIQTFKYYESIKDWRSIVEVAKAFGMSGDDLASLQGQLSKASSGLSLIATTVILDWAITRFYPKNAKVSPSIAKLGVSMAASLVKGSAPSAAISATQLVLQEYTSLVGENNSLVQAILNSSSTNIRLLQLDGSATPILLESLKLTSAIGADLGNTSLWPTQTDTSWKINLINEMTRLRASQIAPNSVGASMESVRNLALAYDEANIVGGVRYARFADEVAVALGVRSWRPAYAFPVPNPVFQTANSTPLFP